MHVTHVMVQRLHRTESWDIAEQLRVLPQDRRLARAGRQGGACGHKLGSRMKTEFSSTMWVS